MEIILLITGLILGIVLKRITNIIRTSVLLMSTFLVIKLFHPEIYLLSPENWTLQNIFFGYNFWWLGIIVFGLTYVIIYMVFPKYFYDYFIVKFSQIMFNKYVNYSEQTKKQMENSLRPYVKFFFKIFSFIPKSWYSDNNSNKTCDDGDDLNDYYIDLSNMLILLIHSSIVTPFFFDDSRVVFTVLLVVFLYHLLILPVVSLFYESINNVVNEL